MIAALPLAGVFGLGGPELLLIFAVVMLLFGAKKLPELAKGLGKSMKEFKKASSEDDAEEVKPTSVNTTAEKKVEPVRTHGTN